MNYVPRFQRTNPQNRRTNPQNRRTTEQEYQELMCLMNRNDEDIEV